VFSVANITRGQRKKIWIIGQIARIPAFLPNALKLRHFCGREENHNFTKLLRKYVNHIDFEKLFVYFVNKFK